MDISKILAALPESQKMKIYLASLLGVIEAEDKTDPTKKLAVYYHTPHFIEAQDIKMAVSIASIQANELWPKTGGWKMRSVAVEPLPHSSIKLLLQYWQQGVIAQETIRPEEGITVNLDAAPQQSTIVETDKPAS